MYAIMINRKTTWQVEDDLKEAIKQAENICNTSKGLKQLITVVEYNNRYYYDCIEFFNEYIH